MFIIVINVEYEELQEKINFSIEMVVDDD